MVYIRADAGPRIGWGHLVRCGALAGELQRRGCRVVWLLRGSDEAARRDLEQRFEVRRLSREIVGGPGTRLPPEFRPGDWVVVDRYGWGLREQKALRGAGARLLWLDDSGRGTFHAHLVLNQNLGAEPSKIRAATGTRLLLGTRYALLRPEFSSCPPRRRRFPARAARILVAFGGGDSLGMGPRLCRLLPGFRITCVAGPSARDRAFPPGVELVRSASAGVMRTLMERADMALVSASSICWELARLGVPMAVLGVADNQEPLRRALREAGLACDLGRRATIREARVGAALLEMAADPAGRRKMSAAGRRLVDGRGVNRVADAMGVSG